MIVFLIEFITERYVEQKYGLSQGAAASGVQTNFKGEQPAADDEHNVESTAAFESESLLEKKERVAEFSFRQQISAFLILEFGIIFHSKSWTK